MSRGDRLCPRWWVIAIAGAILGASGCGGPGAAPHSTVPVGAVDSAVSSCATGSTLKGVDVSNYQGGVDWASVRGSGITFAFAKATEGDTIVDSEFANNWAGMKAAGVVRGAYHFFHPNDSATTQADFVLSTVGTLEAGDLPIVLDFEVLDGVSEGVAVNDAVTFLKKVTEATGKTAIIYMSSDFLSGTYSELEPYTLWVANYGVSCPGLPAEWSSWKFWQDGDSGIVSGISGETDTDEFNGPLSALTALAGGSSGGGSTRSCELAGKTYKQNTCTETLQCDDGSWVARTSDPSSCRTGVEADGACITDTGTVEPKNTCTSTLQCDKGVWVDRSDDPAACL